MRALVLELLLSERIERYEKEFENLFRHLPPEAKRIMVFNGEGASGVLVRIAFPWIGIAQEVGAKLRSTLAAFENWEITEIGGLPATKHLNFSPLKSWMENNGAKPSEIRKRTDADDLSPMKGRQPWRRRTV